MGAPKPRKSCTTHIPKVCIVVVHRTCLGHVGLCPSADVPSKWPYVLECILNIGG